MVKARDNGLIGGIGLSNITPEHLVHALAITGIACVQNAMNLAPTSSVSHLEENMALGDIELDAAAREALASAS